MAKMAFLWAMHSHAAKEHRSCPPSNRFAQRLLSELLGVIPKGARLSLMRVASQAWMYKGHSHAHDMHGFDNSVGSGICPEP